MKSAFVRTIVTAFVVVAIANQVRAEPLKPSQVAANAQWVAHVDIESLAKSQLVQFVLEHAKQEEGGKDGLEEIKQQFGVDVLQDLKALTVYGRGVPDDEDSPFVAIVKGTSAVENVVDRLKQMGACYSQMTVNGATVHTFSNEGEEVFFHIRPGANEVERIVVLARKISELNRGMAVLEGKAPNAAEADHPVLAKATPQPGSILFIAADGVAAIAERHGHGDKSDPASSVLKETKSLALDFGEFGENVFVQASLDIGKSETAANIFDLLNGLVALGKLAANGDPELAPLKEALNSVKLQVKDSTIEARLQQKTFAIIGTLRVLHEVDKMKHGPHGKKGHKVEIGVKVDEKKSEQ